MRNKGEWITLAALACFVSVSAASAQNQTAQNQPAPSHSQGDQYTGVSNPPPDTTIEADESTQPAPAPKPSAAIPATPVTTAKAAPAPAPAATPDDDIVTSVPATNASTTASTGVSLQKRPWNPDDDIVNYVPSDPNALAEGTNIRVRLSQELSTAETQEGVTFRATVDKNVYKDGRVIIPAGSEMRGRVVHVSQGHHLGPHATIRLRPDVVILPDGTAYHLYAAAIQSKAPGTRTNQEGGIEASNHYAKDAVEYGAGAGAAAVVGAQLAGPVGAGIGSLVGAGVVTAHLLIQHPQEAVLPEGSLLVFSLTEPMGLTPTKN